MDRARLKLAPADDGGGSPRTELARCAIYTTGSPKGKVRGLEEPLSTEGKARIDSPAPVGNVGFHLAGYCYSLKRQDDSAKGDPCQFRSFKSLSVAVKKPNGGTRWADVLFLNLLGGPKLTLRYRTRKQFSTTHRS